MSTIIAKGGKSHALDFMYVVLMASAVHTVEANAAGDTYDLGDWDSMVVVLDITASATQAADVLDVMIDVSWDASTWYNAIHFTQQAGNGSAAKEVAFLNTGRLLEAPVTITADATSGIVRPGLIGQYVRVRSTVVRDTGTDESHTFSVKAYVR